MKKLEVFMKKLIFVFFALCAVFGVTAFADEAVVVAVSGKVEVSSGGDWKALSVGQKVGTGDTISTGFKSSLTLEYKTANQSSTMELGPLTRISFDELVSNGDTDNVQLAMRAGSVRTTADRNSSSKLNFTVKSPVATASVRGTSFAISNDGNVSCARGSVYSAPASFAGGGSGNVQGATVVGGGQSATVAANGITSGVYASAADSASSVAATSKTATDVTSQDTSINGMNAVSSRVQGLSGVSSSEGDFISISFSY